MLKPPPPLLITGDVGENYKRWRQRFDLYFTASGANSRLDDGTKVALLLHSIGEEALQIYNTFEFGQQARTYTNVLQKFDDYFTPLKNETMNRHVFFNTDKKESESFDDFVTSLRRLSQDCNFGGLRDSLIRDQIIRGIHEKNVRERLLKESDLDLNKCINICKTYELAAKQLKEFKEESPTISGIKASPVSQQQEKSSNKLDNQRQQKKQCTRCGYTHGFKCPAFNQQCKKCKKYGHYSKMCRNKVRAVNKVGSCSESDDDESVVLGMVQVGSIQSDLYESLQISGKIVDFKLDTGSDCDVLPYSHVKKLQLQNKINRNSNSLFNYDGTKINCVGKLLLKCKLINNKQVELLFHVVDSDCAPVLGHKTILSLKLMERKYLRKINSDSNCYGKIINKYYDLFDEKKKVC